MIKQGQAKFTNPQGGAAIKVRVNVKAKEDRVKKVDAGAGLVTVELTCGKSEINTALTSFLAKVLGAQPSEIEILDGATSLDKVVCVLGHPVERINEALKKVQ
jgi:uncharacterized protein YggU (UPF0235/DUF167 family)